MKTVITGASGLIGSALADSLIADGHEVIRLRRSRLADGAPYWDPGRGIIDMGDITEIDAVVNLAGDSIVSGRWNDKKKRRILDSRIVGTKLLSRAFADSDHKPRVIVSASAVGFYGNQGKILVDETCAQGSGFLADVCAQWESATAPAIDAGIRVANVRFGVVLSRTGGALRKMLLPFKMGLGGVIGSGKQYMSWVSIDDAVESIKYIINHDSLRGSVNIVSPSAVTNHEFTKELGSVIRRPTMLPMPAFAARLAFGEMANELFLSSTRAYPKKLIDSGYKFRHPELREALESIIKESDI